MLEVLGGFFGFGWMGSLRGKCWLRHRVLVGLVVAGNTAVVVVLVVSSCMVEQAKEEVVAAYSSVEDYTVHSLDTVLLLQSERSLAADCIAAPLLDYTRQRQP